MMAPNSHGDVGIPHDKPHKWEPACDLRPFCVPSRTLKPDSYDPPPKHYDGDGITPWDVIDAWALDYYLGNVLKYVCRGGKKDNTAKLDDLVKARNFILKAIEREEKKSD